MKRVLCVILVGVLAYVALAVYANATDRSIGSVEVAAVVGCAMLVAYGVARLASSFVTGRQGL